MKTRLSKTWMPSENVLELARAKGMPIEDWLYHLLPEWKLHWLGSKEKRASWDSTFWNWAKARWLEVDKSRMYRGETTIGELNKPGSRGVYIEQTGEDIKQFTVGDPKTLRILGPDHGKIMTAEQRSIEKFNDMLKEIK